MYWKELEEPIILRPPLQSFIEKDDLQYVNSMAKTKTLDLSNLKFGTGNYYRRDDDDDPNGGDQFNLPHNNPIL